MDIFHLLRYDDWATASLLAAVQSLSPEQFTREFASPASSVRQQFVHLLRVTDRYRARLSSDIVPDIHPESFATPHDLLHYSVQMRHRLNDYVGKLDENDLNLMQEHATLNGCFKITVGQTLHHMVNHATYHRGQVACLLKMHGVDFPDTDLIIWLNS